MVSLLLPLNILTILTSCFSVSIVNFEQVNAAWDTAVIKKRTKLKILQAFNQNFLRWDDRNRWNFILNNNGVYSIIRKSIVEVLKNQNVYLKTYFLKISLASFTSRHFRVCIRNVNKISTNLARHFCEIEFRNLPQVTILRKT